MMPFYGGFAGAGGGYAGSGALRQGQQVNAIPPPVFQLGGMQQGYGQGYWGAGGGGMYGGGYGMRRPNYAQQGGGDAYSTAPAAPMQQQAQPNANYGQQYSQFLQGGQMPQMNYGMQGGYGQPMQQINYSAAPIANRPMTYRPIQQQLPSYGSYSRY